MTGRVLCVSLDAPWNREGLQQVMAVLADLAFIAWLVVWAAFACRRHDVLSPTEEKVASEL